MNCETRERLEDAASEVLRKVIELSKGQQAALAARGHKELMRLDKEMELTFGEKERSFGALRQHTKEHGC